MRHHCWSLLLCSSIILPVLAQRDTRAELDSVRAQFAEQFRKASAVLEQAQVTARDAASERGDRARFEQIVIELERFRAGGRLPTVLPTDKYRAALEKACGLVERKYEAARTAAMVEDATGKQLLALNVELRAFRGQDMRVALEHVLDEELLTNPGAESTIRGRVPYGWDVVEGSWTTRSENPAPFEGQAYFFPGPSARAELSQTVDLGSFETLVDDEVLVLHLHAALRSFSQRPSDLTQLIVEFLDQRRKPLPGGHDTGAISSTAEWRRIAATLPVPKGARSARMRLIGVRRGVPAENSTKNNDAYFDGTSLRLGLDHTKLLSEPSSNPSKTEER